MQLRPNSGDLIISDHKILNVESESRGGHTHALVVQLFHDCIQSYPMKTTGTSETLSCLQRFLPSQKPEIIYTDNSKTLIKLCSRFANISWHKHSSSLRHERSGRKGRPQSERRNSYRNSAKRITRIMMGLLEGMLLLSAERALQSGRWQDSIREHIWQIIWPTINISCNIGWVHPNYRERQVDSTSVLKDNAERNIYIYIGYELRAARGWSGDLMMAGHEDLQGSESSEIFVERFKSQDILVQGEHEFTCAFWFLKISWSCNTVIDK